MSHENADELQHEPQQDLKLMLPDESEDAPKMGWRERFLNKEFINVVVLGLGFMFLFSAFSTTQNFMSTLYGDVGYTSLALVYGFFAFSSFFASAVVQKLGPRLTLVLGATPYVLYVLSSVYYVPAVLLVISALLGIGASLLWTANGNFLMRCAGKTNVGFYSGVFFGIHQINGLIGNLLAATLISSGTAIWVIFLILSILGVIGTVLLMLLRRVDPVQYDVEIPTSDSVNSITALDPKDSLNTDVDIEVSVSPKPTQDSPIQLIRESIKIMGDKRLLLLVGLMLYSGYSNSYFSGGMPATFGQQWIGYAMSGYGVAQCIGSVSFGKGADMFGKIPMVTLTCILQLLGILIANFLDQFQPYIFFVCAITFGLADSGMNTMLYALVGSIWKDKTSVGFAALKVLQSLSTALGLVSGIFMNRTQILCVMAATIVFAYFTFIMLDWFVYKVDAGLKKSKAQQQSS